MTRNRELNLEDLRECDHELEIAVSYDGQIVLWQCRCGEFDSRAKRQPPSSEENK